MDVPNFFLLNGRIGAQNLHKSLICPSNIMNDSKAEEEELECLLEVAWSCHSACSLESMLRGSSYRALMSQLGSLKIRI